MRRLLLPALVLLAALIVRLADVAAVVPVPVPLPVALASLSLPP